MSDFFVHGYVRMIQWRFEAFDFAFLFDYCPRLEFRTTEYCVDYKSHAVDKRAYDKHQLPLFLSFLIRIFHINIEYNKEMCVNHYFEKYLNEKLHSFS